MARPRRVPIFVDQLPLDWTMTLVLDISSFPFRTFPSFSYLAPLPHATAPTSLKTNGKLAARLVGRRVCTNERRFLYGQLYPYLLPTHNPQNTTLNLLQIRSTKPGMYLKTPKRS